MLIISNKVIRKYTVFNFFLTSQENLHNKIKRKFVNSQSLFIIKTCKTILFFTGFQPFVPANLFMENFFPGHFVPKVCSSRTFNPSQFHF